MLIAVDTGGTKVLVASFSQDGQLGEQYRFETPKTPGHYIDLLSDHLIETYGGEDIDAIVIGMPGTVIDNIVVWCARLGWKNFNVIESLKESLKNKNASSNLMSAVVMVDNDANLAGLAETRTLKTIPKSSLYITISTGIGTGIITNGKIDPGLSKSEGGRIQIDWAGRTQEWQDFASGEAIKNTYGKYARDIKSKRAWKQIADKISRGLLVLIPIIQPDIIIVGGSIGTYFDRYELALEKIIKDKLPNHITPPVITMAKHPEQAVLYGCYYYAIDNLSTT